MGDAISCLQIPYALLMAISLTLFLLCIPTITTLVQIIITSDTEGKKNPDEHKDKIDKYNYWEGTWTTRQ